MSREEIKSPVCYAYAQALFNAASKSGELEALRAESKALVDVIKANALFGDLLASPVIARRDKKTVVQRVFEGKLEPLAYNLLNLMIDRDRGDRVVHTFELLEELAEHAEGIWPGRVTTAHELGFEEKVKLKNALETGVGCRLRLTHKVDPGLLGGVLFRFRDTMIDATVKSGLTKIREHLKTA